MLPDDLHRSPVDTLRPTGHLDVRLRRPRRLLADLPQDPRRYAARAANLLGGGCVRGGEDGHEADAEVEGALKVAAGHPAECADDLEDRRRGPGRPVDPGVAAAGQDAGEVGGQATAGDVRERVDVDAGGADEREEVGGIHAWE